MTWMRRHQQSLGHVAMLAMLANIVLAILCCAAPAGGSGASPFAGVSLCTADGLTNGAAALTDAPGHSPVSGHQCDCLAGCMAALALVLAVLGLMLGRQPAAHQPILPAFARFSQWPHRPQWGRAPPLPVR